MVNVVTSYNNFARGKVDHDMMGRFDLPIYNTSADEMQNMITNFKGNAIFRDGLEDMVGEFEDCTFLEFEFNNEQNYIIVAYDNKFRFLTYASDGSFGWVLDGGASILEIDTPYTLEEMQQISKSGGYTQNSDVMILTHENYNTQKLTRVSANEFRIDTYSMQNINFFTNLGGTPITITNITQDEEPTITATAHSLSVGQAALIQSVGGMTEINDYWVGVTEIVDANNFKISLDTSDFTAYTSGGTMREQPASTRWDFPNRALFYKGRLYFADTPRRPTTIFGSESGLYDRFDPSPTTITDTSAFEFALADIKTRIEWLYEGDNSLIAGSFDGTVAINGGGVNTPITQETFEANITSADGTNEIKPIAKDGLIFYTGKNGRNIYYFNYDLLSESFQSRDSNFISYDITKGGVGKARHKKDVDDLIFILRNDGDLLSLNFKESENIIGWHRHETNGTVKDISVITDNDGNPQLFLLVLRNGAYFIEKLAQRVEFSRRVNFFTGKENKAVDNEAYNRKVAEELNQCNYLDNSLRFNNLQEDNLITYDSGAGTITDTDGVFVSGDVGKHISYKTATGYESGRFEITGYTDANTVDVDVLQEPSQDTYSNWYLSFGSLSGLDQYNGQTIGVVTDGGYLADFTVSGGAISFENQVLQAVVGYRYKGVIKSFALGFQIKAENTQTTMKAISRFGVRTVSSAGMEVGSDLYRMEEVQRLSQNDLNYLPPIPIDGTKYVSYTDSNEKDKYFYIVQDKPLPAVITNVMIECNYTVTR